MRADVNDGATVEQMLERDRAEVEARLQSILAEADGIPDRLARAMAHSVLGGGTRLRPILLLQAHDAFGGQHRGDALNAGAALEMVHTYSLIHDDLPAMDDDDLRRGRPTCHVAFDEATAILAGDGLLTWAFGLLSGIEDCGAKLAGVLATAAGPAGMVGGQQEDLDSEGVDLDAALVRRIHTGKTARLIAAPLAMGAILAGADASTVDAVESAGLELGLAFQAADDALDVSADTATLGKTAGKDERAGKPTWVRLEGLEGALARAKDHGEAGTAQLQAILGDDGRENALIGLCRKLWERSR